MARPRRCARTKDERRDLIEQRHRLMESRWSFQSRSYGGDERDEPGRVDLSDDQLERAQHVFLRKYGRLW